MQFRAEFFNLWNNANFTLPVSSLSSPGRYVNNATPPRIIPFVLKVGF